MATFCIPRKIVDVLNTSALKNEVDLEKLYLMDSKTRRDFFSKYTDKETGRFINTKFEQAMVSKQQNAIMDWAQSVFTPTEKKKPAFKTVMDKIAQLTDMGVLNEKAENAFLEDLVTDKLGASLTAEEMQNITEKAKKVEEAQSKLGPDLGNPEKLEENIAFFKALKEINDYMQEVEPSSKIAIWTSTIGRGMMLAAPKSAILNIGSNIILGTAEAVTRRIANGSVRGGDNKLALSYIKMARAIYKETGYDISRLQDIGDLGASGERVLGETMHTKGEGFTRKLGAAVEDIVFKNLMGAPDAAFGSVHFADSVNLLAMRAAKGDKTKAKEIMTDAMRINPVAEIAKAVRKQAVLDAEYATWTNKSWASDFSLRFRKLLNDSSNIPDVAEIRLGDFLMPFVKTPANVISTGIDYSLAPPFRTLLRLVSMYRTGTLKSEAQWRDITRDLARMGLGLTAAAILMANVDEEDFVGAFEFGRYQLDKLRNTRENSFKVGDTWISTDWLGPIAVPFTAMMYAKKYGKDSEWSSLIQLGYGVFSNVKKLPGIEDAADWVLSEAPKGDLSANKLLDDLGGYLITQGSSRLIPSVMSDVAKALDDKERVASSPIEALAAKAPGLRNTLDEKVDVFGEVIKTENPFFTLVFGARVKTSREDSIIREVVKVVNESGKNINFTDWEKSNSKKLAQFKSKVGEARYKEATQLYGQTMRSLIKSTIRTTEYRKADIEERNDILSSLDTKAVDKVFEKYNFKYTSDKKKK